MNGSALRRALGLVVLLATLFGAAPANAEQQRTVKWNDAWPRVHLVEVANIAVLTFGSAYIHGLPYHREPTWRGPILFDQPVRSLFKLQTASAQSAVARASDVFYRGMVVAPYIIDNYLVALGVHQNADVALQMTLINLQSLGLSGVISLGAQHAIGRARPYTDECPPSGVGPTPIGFNHCGDPADNQSFYSGHAAAAFTMAGLTCVHHQHLPLYGGGWRDAIPCGVMLSAATFTGLARLMSDRHWASDVILGAGVGLFNGYLLPLWLHYSARAGKAIPTSVDTSVGRIAPIPQVYAGGAGLGIAIF